MLSNTGKFLQQQRSNSALWKKAFYGVLALLVVLNIFIHPHNAHFALEKYPGFWALFGLVGAILLTKVAKGIAHTVLNRTEDFYD